MAAEACIAAREPKTTVVATDTSAVEGGAPELEDPSPRGRSKSKGPGMGAKRKSSLKIAGEAKIDSH